jgi:hypothetical protein
MLQRLTEKQAECLETAAWCRERAAAHPALRQPFLQMAACWEGLARSYSSSELKDFVATYCGTSPFSATVTQHYPASVPENIQSSQARVIGPNSLECAERASEIEDAARRSDNAFLQQGLHRLADAWRRLAAAYQLSEDFERNSAK